MRSSTHSATFCALPSITITSCKRTLLHFVTTFYELLYRKCIYVGDKRHEINLCHLKGNKSSDDDGLTGEFYKVFQEDISELLLHVSKEALIWEEYLKICIKALSL